MSALTREKLLRIGLFLFLVVVLCVIYGILLSQVHVGRHLLQDLSWAFTLVAVFLSYLGAYRPGWVYRSFVESAQGGS